MDDGSGGLAWVIGRAHALGLRKPSTSSDGSEPSAPAPAEQSSLVVSHRDAHRQLVHSAQVRYSPPSPRRRSGQRADATVSDSLR